MCPRFWSSPISGLEPERALSSGGACLDADFRKITLAAGWLQGERWEDWSGGGDSLGQGYPRGDGEAVTESESSSGSLSERSGHGNEL